MFFPQYRAEVLAAFLPLLTESLRIAFPTYGEDQIVVRVNRDSPIELFVAVGPFRATVREDPGIDGSVFLVLTQFIEQTPREMQMGSGFRPEMQGGAGELHAVLSGLHARLLRLEGKSGESAVGFVRGREEGAHNGRWGSREADCLDLMLNHLAQYHPLKFVEGTRPQDTLWFVINEFKRCAFNTATFKKNVFEKYCSRLVLCEVVTSEESPAIRLDKLDDAYQARPRSEQETDLVQFQWFILKHLLLDVMVCTYLSKITHDEDRVIDVFQNRPEIYPRIWNIVNTDVDSNRYSKEWVRSVKSEMEAYKSMEGSTEAKDALLETLKGDILHYEEDRSEEARSKIAGSDRQIRSLLSGRR